MNHAFDKKLISLQSLNDWQQLRVDSGIKLEQSRDYDIGGNQVKIFWTKDNIFFIYFSSKKDKITKAHVKELMRSLSDLINAKYLVLMLQKDQDPQIVWVDLANKNNPKITSFHIDTKGIFNLDEDRTVYKNRTLIEQFEELKKDLAGGERELKVRYLKKFFEKQKLTEDFYAIYKVELFDKIKKNLTNKFGKTEEESINNFILLNLNRLLFIHFLDKKGWIFPEYDPKRWSYISYLFHDVYKSMWTEKPFYDMILKPLFFEVFNKSQYDRKIAHDPILFKEFYNLPYLNGGLFKESKYEIGRNFFIDNVFIQSFITKVIDQFNFTITEDTPFDVKVSVDPELLGYIFENLIQDYDNSKDKAEDERSKWGIFYTPKIEVDFMCRQVLIEYLSKQEELKDLKPHFYELFYAEKWWSEDQKYWSFTWHQIWLIFKYLEEIKVVDPACGSWAFLVGMMQVILDIEKVLLNQNNTKLEMSTNALVKAIKDKTDFQRKKQLIKSSLHGVDIKPWAVEIAKLRLWLSMIVDIDSSVFQKDSIKTEALLPSFWFKVVQGDSLVNRIGTNLIPIDLSRKDILDKKMRDKIADLTQLKNDYYDNKNKDEYNVKKAEAEIYETILSNKITRLKWENTKLENTKNSKSDMYWMFGKSEFGGEFNTEKLDTKKIDKSIEDNKSQIEILTKQLQDITLHGQIPFARGIDFSEIFTEKGWFDIIVGNPPYVRQEGIEDPTWAIKDKKEYKNLLVDVVNQDWFDDLRKYRKDDLKIGGRSDLYLYFYFRGLKLLNDQWVFTFITSNSWLDVDFGSVFQEFLIKYCPSIKVFDNQVQRSFASASVNTIMCFFDKPVIQGNNTMTGKAQFVNFHKPYEESIWTEAMAELDHQTLKKVFVEKIIKTGDAEFSKRTTDELRVIDIDANNLWIDGSEAIGGEWLNTRKYEWNKWGWKFLNAPDIYLTILEKWINKFIKLGSISKTKYWIKSWASDFFYLPNKYFDLEDNWKYFDLIAKNQDLPKNLKIEKEFLKPVLISWNRVETIKIPDWFFDVRWLLMTWEEIIENTEVNKYINWWESMGFHDRPSTWKTRKLWYVISKTYEPFEIMIPYFYTDRFFVSLWNKEIIANKELFTIKVDLKEDTEKVIYSLNSSIFQFWLESHSASNIPSLIKIRGYDIPLMNQILNIDFRNFTKARELFNRIIWDTFTELWFDKTKPIREQTPTPLSDRKELDDIIFDELGLTPEERNEVYRSLAELVKARLDKAKSV